jgi:hypothetical protein
MDIVLAIMNKVVEVLEEELVEGYPEGDNLRPRLVQRGVLQDNPENWSPYLYIVHHPVMGSVPDEDYPPEMGGEGRVFTNYYMVMGRLVHRGDREAAGALLSEFVRRTRRALVRRFNLDGLQTETERLTGCNRDFIDRIRTHETGGENEWHMSFVIECHWNSEPIGGEE